MQQLEQVGKQINVPVFIEKKQKSTDIYQKFENELNKFDVVIIDTAERRAQRRLNRRNKNVNDLIKPDENLLVISADIGQTAQKQAEAFHSSCGITGLIVKNGRHSKGGGALSACTITNAPIKFIGLEKSR